MGKDIAPKLLGTSIATAGVYVMPESIVNNDTFENVVTYYINSENLYIPYSGLTLKFTC